MMTHSQVSLITGNWRVWEHYLLTLAFKTSSGNWFYKSCRTVSIFKSFQIHSYETRKVFNRRSKTTGLPTERPSWPWSLNVRLQQLLPLASCLTPLIFLDCYHEIETVVNCTWMLRLVYSKCDHTALTVLWNHSNIHNQAQLSNFPTEDKINWPVCLALTSWLISLCALINETYSSNFCLGDRAMPLCD